MKKIIIVLVTLFTLTGSYKAESQISTGISFNTFYTQLSPYGRWINNPDYGQVWIADVNGFEPYSNNGYWEYTNWGWTWVSDFDWGWAPFHYGRWTFIPTYGWAWVPGYEWAPAWVSWCQYDGYYGWAPMAPGWGFNMGFSNIPFNYWRFVRYQYINSHDSYRHHQRPSINSAAYNQVTIINNTQVNNNVTYAAGPAQEEVEKVTRKKIAPKQIEFTDEAAPKKAVAANEIKIYRPGIKNNVQDNNQPGQPVKLQPDHTTTAPANTGEPATDGIVPPPVKQPVKNQPQAIKEEGQPAVVKPVTKQPEAVKEGTLPVPVKDQQLQPVRNKDNEAVKQEAVKRQEATDESTRQQTELKRQQEASARQQQMDQQQAAAQERYRQEAEQRKQQAELRKQQQEQMKQQQAELRRQQQEQMRQEKMQQQQQRREEKEQRALPQPQPTAPREVPPPSKPNKKG